MSPDGGKAEAVPLARLMTQSLVAWRLIGRVSEESDGAVRIDCLGRQLRIAPADPELPFRWMVTVDGRTRPALSIVAVLRSVRTHLDAGYAPARVRIAVASVEP